MDQCLLRWENEGGATLLRASEATGGRLLLGSASQVEWAQAIRARVSDEFDRVATALQSVAHRQDTRKRSDTEAVIAILEDKRVDVLSRDRAGYFIRDWQEISGQVRQMISQDSRYQAIKAERASGNTLSGGR
jgi:hypothetical protein